MWQEINSFKDVSIASHQNIRERDYWLNQLSGELSKSSFPYDYNDYAAGTIETAGKDRKNKEERMWGRIEFGFGDPLFSQLMKISKEIDYTLHMILTAAAAALLGRYSGNSDIILGMPIYRQDSDEEFVNKVVALRIRLDDSMTFKNLLMQARQTIIDADQYQNYAIEALLYHLDIPCSGTDFPLFDCAVLLENVHDKTYLEDIPLNAVFSFLRGDAGLTGVLEYSPLRYREETAQQVAGHFACLLESFLQDMDARIAVVEFLAPLEKQRLLVEFNNTAMDFPLEKTIVGLLEAQVERIPDRIALVGAATAGIPAENALSYREFNRRANRLAHLLRQKGAIPNTLVGIMADRTLDTMIAVAGILKAGAAYLPIDPESPISRIVPILEDAGTRIILTKNAVLENFTFTSLQGLRRSQALPLYTAPRSPIADLDNHPFPDRSLVDYDKYNRYIGQSMATKTIVIQASRGCPYYCAYCHKIWPKTYAVRSAEHIFSEVKLNYDMGMRQFAFVDDIFNLNRDNSMKFFQLIINSGLNRDIQFYFPNGLRGDILTRDYIDLMAAAGTMSCALALETASPRLQKLLRKNLDLDKFRDNINYICEKYPHIILELFTMHGFPSETEEEALMTLDFIKSVKWIHFPYINMLKIYPNTDMEKLALENGVTRESILRSENYAHTEVSDNCTLEKSFTLKYRSDFLYDYFLVKERLLHVLPYQMKILTREEILQKYNSYLSTEFTQLEDLLTHLGIGAEEAVQKLIGTPGTGGESVEFHSQWVERSRRTAVQPAPDALRILLLDMSQFFTGESEFSYDVMGEAPLGMLYLLTYLNRCFGAKIKGKIAKSRMDFDSFAQLKALLEEFQPDVIGLRTLSIFKDFFHHTIALIRQWGFEVPIIVGGPYSTSDTATVLQDRNVDLAVLGEGEITFSEIITAIMAENGKLPAREKLEQIRGIAFMPRQAGNREVLLTDALTGTLAQLPEENPVHVNRSTDLAYSIFTSGSTGRSKGVLIEHRHVHHLVVGLKARIYDSYGSAGALKVGLVSPFVFDASVKQIFAALLQGHCLCIIPEHVRTDVEQLFEFYRKSCINVADGTPAHIGMLTEAMSESRSHPGVKHFLIGGEALSRRVVEEFFNRIPAGAQPPVFTNVYGPSECTVDTTAHDISADSIRLIDDIPIGKPMPNSRVYILDAHGNVVPIGVTGELCIGGAGVGRGYLNDPQLTSEKFDQDLWDYQDDRDEKNKSLYGGFRGADFSKKAPLVYHTGDLARWLLDGNIVFAGRSDQQVKIRGFRIELEDIEKQLRRHKHVKDAVVIARQNQKEDKYLCAYMTWNTDVKESDIPELREYLAEKLPEYMIPSRFVRLETLPLTPNGKIDRRGLPAPESEAGATYSPPRDRLEERLVETWSDLLGKAKDKLGIDDNFFEIGGHSLKVTILIARMHKAFNVKIPLTEIFRGPSIRELAVRIRKAGAQEDFSAIPLVEKKEYYPLTSAMTRLYFEQQLDPQSTAYNISSVAVLEGKLDRKRFTDAFKELLRRHESLRTSFQLLEGQPVQKVHESETVEFDVAYGHLNISSTPLSETIESFFNPFDLSRPPLMRVGLFKSGETEHVLVVNINHIVADGTSITILGWEFMALYNNETLPPLKLQYKDFSEWKYRQISQEHRSMEKQEQFWLEQFSGEIPVLTLPYDYPRPARKSSAGDVIETVVGEVETRRLRALVTRENATLYILGLSLFNVLLMKLSGQEDIVVGSPNAGRMHVDLEPLIGMFVNTLPLRNHPRGNVTFQVFLKEVKERTLAAFANQDYAFETLVGRVMVQRDPSRSPLADVFFAVQNMERPVLETPGLRMRPYEHGHFNARFDMCFHVFEVDQELHFMMEYCTHLFKRETVEMFIKNFNEVAAAVLENPAITLRDIVISTEIENVKVAASQVDLGF